MVVAQVCTTIQQSPPYTVTSHLDVFHNNELLFSMKAGTYLLLFAIRNPFSSPLVVPWFSYRELPLFHLQGPIHRVDSLPRSRGRRVTIAWPIRSSPSPVYYLVMDLWPTKMNEVQWNFHWGCIKKNTWHFFPPQVSNQNIQDWSAGSHLAPTRRECEEEQSQEIKVHPSPDNIVWVSGSN